MDSGSVSQGPCTYTWQHAGGKPTFIHASTGIRTHSSSGRCVQICRIFSSRGSVMKVYNNYLHKACRSQCSFFDSLSVHLHSVAPSKGSVQIITDSSLLSVRHTARCYVGKRVSRPKYQLTRHCRISAHFSVSRTNTFNKLVKLQWLRYCHHDSGQQEYYFLFS